MGETIPEWAMEDAALSWAEVCLGVDRLAQIKIIARALAATAERVEWETREADAQNAESLANNYSNTRNMDEAMQNAAKDDHAIFIAKSIRSLPAKYGKAKT